MAANGPGSQMFIDDLTADRKGMTSSEVHKAILPVLDRTSQITDG